MMDHSGLFEDRQLIDLSHPLHPGTPPYPEDPPLTMDVMATVDRDGYALTRWSGVFHTGTHMDAPAHFIPEGWDISSLPVDRWFGKASLVTIPEGQDPDIRHVENVSLPPDIRFLLFRTGWDIHYPQDRYYRDHPVFTPALVEWLSASSLNGVGMDLPSPDKEPWQAHHKLLGNGIILLENLRGLHRLPLERAFDLLCIPLPVQAEASWVRPLALI